LQPNSLQLLACAASTRARLLSTYSPKAASNSDLPRDRVRPDPNLGTALSSQMLSGRYGSMRPESVTRVSCMLLLFRLSAISVEPLSRVHDGVHMHDVRDVAGP
jgi:hypothetical protein